MECTTPNIGIILAIVGTGIAFIAAMIAMFLWLRTESNANRRDIQQLLREMKDEMKDFHSRLLILEERYLNFLEKEKK